MGAEFGKNKVLMFRKLGDTKSASKLALQTEHTLSYERTKDTTKTKDGAVVSDGGLEVKLSIQAISTKDEVNKLLKDSVVKGFDLEVWEIDLAGTKDENGKYPALYMRGSLSTWEVPANVEELVTIETELIVTGVPVEGYATLTQEQEEAIMYVFTDVVEKGA